LNFTSDYHKERIGPDSYEHTTSTADYQFSLQPQFLISIADFIEINPFIGISRYTLKHYDDGELVATQLALFGLDGGCGCYARIVKGELLRFSMGLRIAFGNMSSNNESLDYEEYVYAFIGVPANIDLRFSDHFFMRASPEVVQLGVESTTFQEEDSSDNAEDVTDYYFRVMTQLGVSLGFFFTF
jgi:hypothetical protein